MLFLRDHCPVCQSNNFRPVFKAKDFTVSGESFEIVHCSNCSFRFTNPAPQEKGAGKYYQSEDYISHSNTASGLINSIYQKVRKFTLGRKRRLVEKMTGKRTGNILDLGCGTGNFLNEMKSSGWNVAGVEPSEGARKIAESHFEISVLPSEEFLKFSAESFDALSMWHVLEHVYSLDKYLIQIKKVLRKNGKAFIAVPNYESYDARKYKEVWAAYDVPRHLYHWNPASMRKLLENSGLKLIRIKRMPFDSFYVSMLSEKYRKGSLISGIWVGFISWVIAAFNKERCSSLIYVVENSK